MVSVLILTLNEELNLPRCLASVSWSDDVVVLDSLSADRTVAIAEAAGARVHQRAFDTWARQCNAALQLDFRHPWVLMVDADEVVPEDLRDEVLGVASHAPRPECAYRIRFKSMFMGRWLRHSSLYPTWVVRLFRPAAVRFERSINPRCVVSGTAGRLNSHLLHYSFNKGIEAWLEKHNRYSTGEATETLASLEGSRVPWSDLVRRDPVVRRRALKELSFRLPWRPSLRFLYMYLVRRGFLDGYAGYTYCRLLAMYEYMIVLKIRELRRRQQGLPM